MPPLDQPARDDYVEVTEEGDPTSPTTLYVNGDENHVPTDPEEQKHFFHGLMDAELCAAELMARNSHEHPEMPWDFHVDMARQMLGRDPPRRGPRRADGDRARLPLGRLPDRLRLLQVDLRLDLLGRLVLFNGTSEQKAMWRHSHRRKVLIELGQTTVARVFDYLLADEVPHVHNGVRWGTHLLGGDEEAYREKVRELRAGLDATGHAGRDAATEASGAVLTAPRRYLWTGPCGRVGRRCFEMAFWDESNGLRANGRACRGPCPRRGRPCRGPSGRRAPDAARGAGRGRRG